MWQVHSNFLSDYDICVFGISVISRTRNPDRIIDNRKNGRSKHGLLYLSSGTVCFSSEDSDELIADGGKLVFIPKGHKYRMKYIGESTSFILLNFDMMTPDGDLLTLSNKIELISEGDTNKRIVDTLEKLKACGEREDNSTQMRRKELVYRLLSDILEEESSFENSKPKYANIIPGVLMLRKKYLENIPISEFAAACNISVSSFRALFTECYGIAPVQYRNKLRIKRAEELLEDGNLTVAEVASSSGFDNIAYFCRFYKKVTGETPKETQSRNK
jgi:AraC-like DNA-binding protein